MAKNPTFPPIKCPKCKRQKVIVEQPRHGKDKHVEFDCRCVKCSIDFICHANITDISYSNVETDKKYPW